MGGWTVITFEVEDNKATSLMEYLEKNHQENEKEVPVSPSGYDEDFGERVIMVLDGYVKEERAEGIMRDVPNKFYSRVAIVQRNNTSDKGEGWLYEYDPDVSQNVLVENKQGHERARAADVEGHFKEEYDFNAHTHFEI